MGRGSSKAGGSKSGGAKSSTAKTSISMSKPKKHTSKEINSMGRSQIAEIAKYLNIRRLVDTMGITAEEAARRFDMLVNSQTTAQLKSYVKRYQNEYL